MNRVCRYFSCDFETTVYEGQETTEVWASASVELNTNDVHIFHSIDEQFEYFTKLNCHVVAYYHNLKFDGEFWLSYLLRQKKFKQAYYEVGEGNISWMHQKNMPSKTFKYSISETGMWYSILIKYKKHFIEIRDSLKLLPFSVKRIGESFGTKHKKLDMEYKGFRYPGCVITDEEKHYIANDVLVVKEALEIMFNEGHQKLTIGSCCMQEYKNICSHSVNSKLDYDEMFPNLYSYGIDEKLYGINNAGDYIRKAYRGGWCYAVKGKTNKVYRNGTTADVNSLYPSMMHSESGNYYPIGKPNFWKGNYIPDDAIRDDKYYYVRVKTRFYIKKDKLPFIQIKKNYLYKGTESLETSDVYDKETGQYYTHYMGKDGELKDTRLTMTLSMTDYKLIKEHYELVDFEILDGCWFFAMKGIFDEYIDKYKEIKLNSEGARRELAKLFLNNLYGKFASNTNSSFKVAYLKEDGTVGYTQILANDKEPGYIAVGAAITSYARNFTIRAAQQNYYGVDKPGFIYADTDSIHCDLPADKLKGITVHKVNFCCWALEAYWDTAIFTRQKTYIEHVTHKDTKPVDNPYYDIKCAGMPERCKNLFLMSMGEKEVKLETPEQEEFVKTKRTLADFTQGLCVPGKLAPRRMPGGILLTDTTYELR